MPILPLSTHAVATLGHILTQFVISGDCSKSEHDLFYMQGLEVCHAHLLACAASASHVKLSSTSKHNHPIVVAACCVSICFDLDVVNVLVAVRLLPQLLDDLVDVSHLGSVERQQSLLKRLQEYRWSGACLLVTWSHIAE